jgi:hypothetical protein
VSICKAKAERHEETMGTREGKREGGRKGGREGPREGPNLGMAVQDVVVAFKGRAGPYMGRVETPLPHVIEVGREDLVVDLGSHVPWPEVVDRVQVRDVHPALGGREGGREEGREGGGEGGGERAEFRDSAGHSRTGTGIPWKRPCAQHRLLSPRPPPSLPPSSPSLPD